ncbi:ComEA family DNA-binding protein [Zhouia amylolytica]|uniref:DNA uptake protein n=1 Tax=Zhouia amylolytica AD3 TaxID=1286632 RepID=W2USE2_9FLAO|nr:helix-hairpin-helix domain-containing protein [Zhouia amylolytica]ETN96918.1 hypothetical protein P278_03440 [Zhouia amylolytica AD3]
MKTSSHFRLNKNQRNGMFFLILIILTLQGIYYFFSAGYMKGTSSNIPLESWSLYHDSLPIASPSNSAILYKYDPNYLDDYSGYVLGLDPDVLDRLYAYRATNAFVNSIEAFQEVTKVSDSKVLAIRSQLKFRQWSDTYRLRERQDIERPLKLTVQKQDLNAATPADLTRVLGVGAVFSKRIVKYRALLGGFVEEAQLYEVYGLDSLVVQRIIKAFEIDDLSGVRKININVASVKQLASNVYIDYDCARAIVAYRTKRGKIRDLKELTKIQGFPSEKINLIQVYLEIE